MMHSLPALTHTLDALAPHISAETLEYHWGKHHRGYVDTLNRLLSGTQLADLSLEELVRRSSGGVFNSAGQHFNHSLYWSSLSPNGGGDPDGRLAQAVVQGFGSFASLRTAFTEQATSHFGSGWAWLVRKPDGTVGVETTHDAGCPLISGDTPLLTCDLWEHAYYIDYRNQRARYLESFWQVANWRFAESIFETELRPQSMDTGDLSTIGTSVGGRNR
jgi:Fe-Mn family superoxide dismutase